MADPTIRIRLEDAGGGGSSYPTGLPMPGGGGGGRGAFALSSMLPGMGWIKAGFAGMGVGLTGSALSSQVSNLSNYSPELANAKANSDLRNMQSEMGRAQTLGPSLAKFERRWNEMMNQFYEMGTRILDVLLKLFDAMGPVWDFFITVGQKLVSLVELSIEGWKAVIAAVTLDWKKLDDITVAVSKIIKDILEGQKKSDRQDGDFWLKQFDQIAIPNFKAGA